MNVLDTDMAGLASAGILKKSDFSGMYRVSTRIDRLQTTAYEEF